VLSQEGPHLLDGPRECASGDAEEPGQQVMGADLAEAEDGGQDPVRMGELVLVLQSGFVIYRVGSSAIRRR
jgi:hypothetical protein